MQDMLTTHAIRVAMIITRDHNMYRQYITTCVRIPVSMNKTPKSKNLGQIGLPNTKSGGGEQFLTLECRAKAGLNAAYCLFTDTLITHQAFKA